MLQVIRKLLSSQAAFVAHAAWLVMVSVPAAARGDAITITQWDPGVLVDSPVGYDDDGWTTVENPCHRTLYAQAGNSVSSSTIDFAWAEQFGTFLIQSQQAADGTATGPLTVTSASGYIRVVTTEPLFLNIDSVWNYSLPVGFMAGYFRVRVYSPGSPPTVLFHQAYSPQSIPGEPSSGTLSIQGDIILPPGPTWIMTYTMESSAYSGTQGYAATGDGYVNLQITPEPFTLALLAPLLLAVPRRSARRCAR